jgi:DNA-binding response OmpR family regulator
MQDQQVLIVSEEPLTSALLAALVQLTQRRPVFMDGDRPAREVIEELRPSAILLDIDHVGGMAAPTRARARLLGIPILLFSPSRIPYEVERRAAELGLLWFPLPISHREFSRILGNALGTS